MKTTIEKATVRLECHCGDTAVVELLEAVEPSQIEEDARIEAEEHYGWAGGECPDCAAKSAKESETEARIAQDREREAFGDE